MPKANSIFLDVLISTLMILLILTIVNLVYFFNEQQVFIGQKKEQELELYYESLFENLQDLIIVLDIEGNLNFSSKVVKQILGYEIDQFIQIKKLDWIHPDDRWRCFSQLQSMQNNAISRANMQIKILTAQNQIKVVDFQISKAEHIPKINGFVAVLKDISEKVTAEKKILNQSRLYQLLIEVSKEFLHVSPELASRFMLNKIGNFSGVDRAYIYLLSELNNSFQCFTRWESGLSISNYSEINHNGIPIIELDWVVKNFLKQQIINIEFIDNLPMEAEQFKSILTQSATISILLIPIIINGKILGFFGYETTKQSKKWQFDDINALKICAEIFASAYLRSLSENETLKSLSVNRAIIESTAEGILVTDLNDNIISYNSNFKRMWQLDNEALLTMKESVALNYALKNVKNKEELVGIISESKQNIDSEIRMIIEMTNNTVIESISLPHKTNQTIVGRVWSNRDITKRYEAEKAEIQKRIAQAQFESLKNQVNPHFLFNSLNVLSSLVHIDADLSENFIYRLAKCYRYLLEQKDKALVTLKTELDFADAFSFLLKIRFEDKLHILIEVDESIRSQFLIAPLTLQLLIENAVKHNSISNESPLIIKIYLESGETLVVENNLQLRQQKLIGTAVGKQNILQRYTLLGFKEPDFLQTDNFYIVKIPLIEKQDDKSFDY
jgi:PAS domain S-box-containing protein